MENNDSDLSPPMSDMAPGSWSECWEQRVSIGSGSSEMGGLLEDKEIAACAVAFVVNSSRKGIVPLCADVAALLAAKKRLERKLQSLEHENKVLRAHVANQNPEVTLPRPCSQCCMCGHLPGDSPRHARQLSAESSSVDSPTLNNRLNDRLSSSQRNRQGAFSKYDEIRVLRHRDAAHDSSDDDTKRQHHEILKERVDSKKERNISAEMVEMVPVDPPRAFPPTDDPPHMTNELHVEQTPKICPVAHISREVQCHIPIDVNTTTTPSGNELNEKVALRMAREEIATLKAKLKVLDIGGDNQAADEIYIENECRNDRHLRHRSLPTTSTRKNVNVGKTVDADIIGNYLTQKYGKEKDSAPASFGGKVSLTNNCVQATSGPAVCYEFNHNGSDLISERPGGVDSRKCQLIPLVDLQSSVNQSSSSSLMTSSSASMTSQSSDVEARAVMPKPPVPAKSSFCQKFGIRRKKSAESPPKRQSTAKPKVSVLTELDMMEV